MIAIWGANGFIGRHITFRLAKLKEDTRLFARDFDNFPFDLPESAQTFARDFARAEGYINDMADCRVAVLLVSASHPRAALDDPALEQERQVAPYRDFFAALKGRKSALDHIVYLSSGGAVYGVTENAPVAEDHSLSPVNPYGRAKQEIERLITEHAKNARWTYTILRPANPVGVWSGGRGLVAAALQAANDEKPLTVWGDGGTVRDYFDVRELAQAVKLVMEVPETRNKIYNIGSGKGYTVNEVIDIVKQVTGRDIPVQYGPAHGGDVPYNVLDCGRIKKDAGWTSERGLEVIVREMWETMGTQEQAV